jgi:MerR family transcriptional regulator, light-induced transcriptional regulator
MSENTDFSFGEVSVFRPTSADFEITVQPPIAIIMDDERERETRLAALAAKEIIPRLLALHRDIVVPSLEEVERVNEVRISELSRLLLGAERTHALDYILDLRDRGLSLDQLHADLLEPAARYLGELWSRDEIDFVDVTIGVSRLQRLVHYFAGLDRVEPYDAQRRALITTTPGDQHSFGNTIVQKFLRASGWCIHSCVAPKLEDVAAIVSVEWFAVVGFSVSADIHLKSLTNAIAEVRAASKNPTVGIMVGGPCFEGRPELVAEVGADGTALNGPAAVLLAKKLLIPSLCFAPAV